MNSLQLAKIGLDTSLVLLGIYFAFAAMEMRRAKGSFGIGFVMFCWALVLLGFVHLLETIFIINGVIPLEWNELLHRILVLFSFFILIYGFVKLKKDIFIPK